MAKKEPDPDTKPYKPQKPGGKPWPGYPKPMPPGKDWPAAKEIWREGDTSDRIA